MSYVAERTGGGPQDLLRGFEPLRSCKESIYGKQWLDLDGRCFYIALFYGGCPGRPIRHAMRDVSYLAESRFIGSVLFVRRTGMRSSRARSVIRQEEAARAAELRSASGCGRALNG